MKVLTVCRGGNVRSVSLGFLMKHSLGHDAIACGFEKNTPETINMLAQWADKIVTLSSNIRKNFEEITQGKYKDKTLLFDVGQDRWFNPMHPELVSMLSVHVGYHPEFKKAEDIK